MYRQIYDYRDGLDPVVSDKFIQRVEDKAFIPIEEDNTAYKDYLAWVAEGNTILPPE